MPHNPDNHPLRTRPGGESGQAMTEAAIGLALMAFAWALCYFSTYMVNHAGRCAIAARHAAWSKGNGVEVSADTLRADLFHDNQLLVRLNTWADPTSDASGKLSSNVITDYIFGIFPDIQKAEVSFGVNDGDSATTWPFTLTRTRFPFMPDSTMPTIMQVLVHCEWDTVAETWDDLTDILKGILGDLMPI